MTVARDVCRLLLCLLYINLKPAKTADWSISALQRPLVLGLIIWRCASSVSAGRALLRRCASAGLRADTLAPLEADVAALARDFPLYFCGAESCGLAASPGASRSTPLTLVLMLEPSKPTDASQTRHPVTFAQFHISYALWKSVNFGLRPPDSSYHPVRRLFHPGSHHCC